MKIFKYLSSILLVSSLGLELGAETLDGTWGGTLHIQGHSLRMVFHITARPERDSLPKVLMDSPDQGAKDIPVTTDFWTPDSIAISAPALGMKYTGKLAGDSVKGTFSQMGISIPLNLTRELQTRNRPQTPQPPFPYKTEEVTFTGETPDVSLAGTLTLPPGFTSDTPVVLMVSGSGLQDRDETIFEHKPFAVLADRLGRAGIASLRYNDRSVPPSTGNATAATTADFAKDASGGINYLRNRGFKKIGILGHSEGGTIAFILANDADFIVTLGAPAVSGAEIMTDQLTSSMRAAGLGEAECERCRAVFSDFFKALSEIPTDAAEQTEYAHKAMDLAMQKHSGPQYAEWMPISAARNNMQSILAPWMLYFINYSPDQDIREATAPALALYGEKDMQVRPALNERPLRNLNKRVNVKVYQGLNHLMQPCKTGGPTEYSEIETTIDEAVIADIVSFIKSLN